MATSLSGYNSMAQQNQQALKGSGYKYGQMQRFTPEQMQLFQNMFSQVQPDSYLSRLAGGDQDLLNAQNGADMREFNAIQGNVASRFSGMGHGARSSSGFQNTMNQASSDFASDLQSRRQMLQRQALMDLMGISDNLLNQSPYEDFIYEPQKKRRSIGSRLMGGLLPIAGAAGGFLMGGPMGAYAGGQAGYAAGQAFQ
jgi:hypothetical protein